MPSECSASRTTTRRLHQPRVSAGPGRGAQPCARFCSISQTVLQLPSPHSPCFTSFTRFTSSCEHRTRARGLSDGARCDGVLFAAFPGPFAASSLPFRCLSTTSSLPFLDLSLPFRCLSWTFRCLSLPSLDLSLPFRWLSLTFRCLFAAFPGPSTAFSLPFLDLSLPFRCLPWTFRCLFAAFPGPFAAFSLPFIDLPLPFRCLSLTFHCLFAAFP